MLKLNDACVEYVKKMNLHIELSFDYNKNVCWIDILDDDFDTSIYSSQSEIDETLINAEIESMIQFLIHIDNEEVF